MNGILESNTIYVVVTRPIDKFSRHLVAPKKRLKNGSFDLFAWLDFFLGARVRRLSEDASI